MANEPKGGGIGLMVAAVAMIACCAVPLLVLSGAFVGIGAWFSGGGVTWLVAGAVLAAAALVVWRVRGGTVRHESRDRRAEMRDRARSGGDALSPSSRGIRVRVPSRRPIKSMT